MIYYFCLLLMTILGASASLFLKKASDSESICKLICNRNIYVGGGLYVLATLLNIYVLRYLEYTVVLPITSFTYVWTMIISHFSLGEKITKWKICGVAMIVIGALLVAKG